jgi:hypothetical protein
VDIHKPKPWRGWREFLKEYAIIVVGVLTALGAEQSVEALRHRAEADEARRAIQDELGDDLNAFAAYAMQSDCARRRVDELSRWQRSWAAGAPIKLLAPSVSPTYIAFRTNVWRVASSTGVTQMPFEDRVSYGRLYDLVSNGDALREDARHRWEEVAQATAAKALTLDEINRIGGDLDQLRQINQLFDGNFRQFRKVFLRVGLKPPPMDETDARQRLQPVCRPLLTP